MSGRCTVLVVAKAPVPGQAKTRLTPPFTPQQGANLAAAALLDTLDAVLAVPGIRRVVAFTGDVAEAARSEELAEMLTHFELIDQRGVDFGLRLVHAHADAGPGPILQIGMDTPQVTAELLAESCATLADNDAVLGYALDGGWWALGVQDAAMAAPLASVPMSATNTGVLTLDSLLDQGLRVTMLPELRDVDTLDDLAPVAELCHGRFAATVRSVTS